MDHCRGDLLASLGEDLQSEILKVLHRNGDKGSIQAVLQASRDLRLRASSFIRKLVVRHDDAMSRFPRHATITSLELKLRLSSVVEWLNTAALTGRLLHVTRASLVVELPFISARDADDAALDELLADGDDLEALLAVIVPAVARACPTLSSLVVSTSRMSDEILTNSFFVALRDNLPNLSELEVEETHFNGPMELRVLGIDWAACLPGLTKLHLKHVNLHHALLQNLVSMPLLVDVAVWSLSSHDDDLRVPVQSDTCAWRKLQLGEMFPHFRDVCRFTTWPSSVKLIKTWFTPIQGHPTFYWDIMPDVDQTDTVATAAQKLSTCDLSSSGTFKVSWLNLPEGPASPIRIISALAPLAASIPALCLENCPITASLLDDLARSLPHTHTLFLKCCAISDDAWVRLLTLSSVTALSFKSRVPLAEAVALAASVPRAMTLWLDEKVLRNFGARNRASWDVFVASLAERRMASCLPPVLIAEI